MDRLSYLRSTLRTGPVSFVLREGVLGWAVPFCLMMSLVEILWWRNTEGLFTLFTLLLLSLLCGVMFGAMLWFSCTRELWKLEAEEQRQERNGAQAGGAV